MESPGTVIGNLAVIARLGIRPMALRPTVSRGLPPQTLVGIRAFFGAADLSLNLNCQGLHIYYSWNYTTRTLKKGSATTNLFFDA